MKNELVVKTHGHIQNEREKLLAFEREDAMRKQRDEAYAANKEMGDAIERLAEVMQFKGDARTVCGKAIEYYRNCGTFQRRLQKALVTIDELNQAAIDAEV